MALDIVAPGDAGSARRPPDAVAPVDVPMMLVQLESPRPLASTSAAVAMLDNEGDAASPQKPRPPWTSASPRRCSCSSKAPGKTTAAVPRKSFDWRKGASLKSPGRRGPRRRSCPRSQAFQREICPAGKSPPLCLAFPWHCFQACLQGLPFVGAYIVSRLALDIVAPGRLPMQDIEHGAPH